MISENIKYYRKKRQMSQEEMAIKLHVVRQTVSKWENGLSIPDAEMMIHIAELLDVSINVLLGIDETDFHDDSLSKELEKAHQMLMENKQKEKMLKAAYKKRSLIIFLSFITLFVMLIVKNEIVSIILVGICVISSAVILYRNLALLTLPTTNNLKLGILRFTTIFNIIAVISFLLLTLLIELDFIVLSEHSEKIVALLIISGIMIFSGIVCPFLPYNKHTGLRLPWTVADEDTWNVAHQLIGYSAFPVVILYIATTLSFDDFAKVSAWAIACWIGIPALLSLIYFCKKSKGLI